MAWNGAETREKRKITEEERPDGAGRGRTARPFDERPSRHRLTGETARCKARRARRKRILLWGIILLAAVCAIWGIFRLLSGGQTAARDETPSVGRPSLLRAHDPAARGTEPPSTGDAAPAHGGRRARTPEEIAFAETNGLTRLQIQRWWIDRMPPAGYTNRATQSETPPAYRIFAHESENEIAALLTMVPGETLVGTPSYDRWFERDFRKALSEPIAVTEEDTPEQAALKREMVEVREELRRRMDAGEDIAQVMSETREEYQRLADYRETIWGLVRETRRNAGMTDADVEDFVSAANEKLAERGIAPIELGPVTRHMLKLNGKERER